MCKTPTIGITSGYWEKIAYKANRAGVTERLPDEAVQKSIELDLKLTG